MEEFVNKLAELQVQLTIEEAAADGVSISVDAEIKSTEQRLRDLKGDRDMIRRPYVEAAQELKTTIGDLQQTIIDEWDGDKKTLKFDAGTLKFRTTSKLEIYHPEILLADMFVHLQTGSEMLKYLSGFNKTTVRKYIGVHPQDIDIVELVPKTTVSLTTE